ncbi:hypothetical protein ES703_10934 [subsurface metagenome]
MFGIFGRKKEPGKIIKEEKDPIEKRVGKVFVGSTAGKLFPFAPWREKKEKFEKSSKQLAEERKWQDVEGLVSRPYDPSSLTRLISRQPTLASCISVIAQDVSSTGYNLIAKSKEEVEDKEGKKALEDERRFLNGFLQEPNPDDSLKEVISNFIEDYNGFGYAAFECVRNGKGDLVEIYPVKASSLWVHRSREKYCQRVQWDKKAWFKKFGLEKDFSVKTGKAGKGFTDAEKANELIFKKRYGSSGFYGDPPWLSAIGAVTTLVTIEEFNSSWFFNRGIPSYLVTLEGTYDEGVSKIISKFLSTECKGPQNEGKTLVLELPEGGKATFEPVGGEKAKEASYRLYISNLRQDVCGTMHCPGYKVGIFETGKLGGNLGEAALRNYITSTIEPQESLIESIFNNKILPAVLGKEPSFRFELENVDTGDLAEKVDMYVKLFGCGAFTPNQLIERLGLGAVYPEGDRYFVSSNYVEIGAAEYEKADKEFFKGVKKLTDLRKEIKKIREN